MNSTASERETEASCAGELAPARSLVLPQVVELREAEARFAGLLSQSTEAMTQAVLWLAAIRESGLWREKGDGYTRFGDYVKDLAQESEASLSQLWALLRYARRSLALGLERETLEGMIRSPSVANRAMALARWDSKSGMPIEIRDEVVRERLEQRYGVRDTPSVMKFFIQDVIDLPTPSEGHKAIEDIERDSEVVIEYHWRQGNSRIYSITADVTWFNGENAVRRALFDVTIDELPDEVVEDLRKRLAVRSVDEEEVNMPSADGDGIFPF